MSIRQIKEVLKLTASLSTVQRATKLFGWNNMILRRSPRFANGH
jgi:hypothetical protein